MASPAAAKKQQGKTLSFGVAGGLPTSNRAATSVHKLQEFPPAACFKDWRCGTGGRRTQVCFTPIHCSGPLVYFPVLLILSKYRLVLETLDPVPNDRKCFRMINGILVERTVADVIPALKTNAEGLKSVLEGLVKEYKKKQQEMDKWKVCCWKFLSFLMICCIYFFSLKPDPLFSLLVSKPFYSGAEADEFESRPRITYKW